MINNTPAPKPNSVVGLRYRMLNDFSGQIVEGGGGYFCRCRIPQREPEYPDRYGIEAIYKCEEHTCDLILTSDTKAAPRSALRQQKLYATTKILWAYHYDLGRRRTEDRRIWATKPTRNQDHGGR